MKDGKSLLVFTAQRGTEISGYQIITSNNSKKTKKPGKLKARVPAAAPLGPCGDGSGWDELPVHTQHVMFVGLWPGHCSGGSGDTGAVPGLASTGCLWAGPPLPA